MSSGGLKIRRIDSGRDDIRAEMDELRRRLSPRGDVVSRAGRERTIEIFGAPLSPAEVVRRICRDVETKGLEAVLDYSARVDKAELTAEGLRVPPDELAEAHARAEPEFLETVRRVADQITRFQAAM
jgi:histidinol dehydrogenase